MSVKVSHGTPVYFLTSPPEKPTPSPPAELIAEEVTYADRSILVTVPFPDTIELTADVLNAHLTSPYSTGGKATKIYKQIDQDLKAFAKATKAGETLMSEKPFVTGGESKTRIVFDIAYDEKQPLHRARLTLARSPGTDFGSWSVRFEFSASKAQAAGLVQLSAAFELALPFSFSAMLPDFRVSRIDPAIDLIGIRPLDLIAHVKNPGKRLVYMGDDGQPESLYLYERKKPLQEPPASLSYNTLGTLRLKLYERRSYFLQLKLDPPYGDCPVTRAEVELRWKKKQQRPRLADLGEIQNALAGRRVAYAAKLADDLKRPKDWIAFCLAAFGGGLATARQKWPVGAGLGHHARYSDCEGDLVSPSRWDRWSDGLTYTGLDKWIKAAQASG